MMSSKKIFILAFVLIFSAATPFVVQAAKSDAPDIVPQYKADVPASVQTPDTVQTKLLGTLKFFDGMPTAETVRKTYDFLDVARGTEAFLNGIPAASIYALLEGFKESGVKPGELGIFEELMDARSLFLTPNSTTIYCMAEVDVKDGPVVAEVPPGVLGPVDDAFFRFVIDIGQTGPDKGQGGKYLFVHAGGTCKKHSRRSRRRPAWTRNTPKRATAWGSSTGRSAGDPRRRRPTGRR